MKNAQMNIFYHDGYYGWGENVLGNVYFVLVTNIYDGPNMSDFTNLKAFRCENSSFWGS